MKDGTTEPRTITGQAALSGMPPYVKRALGRTIRAIEEEAVRPYAEALREADRVLADVAAGPAADLAERARAVRELAQPLLSEPQRAEPIGAEPARDPE